MYEKTHETETILKDNSIKQNGLLLPLLLLVMGSYPPLSTDMYLPSMPDIANTFNTTDSTANLTLVLFFIFFAFSTLIWGPISDKFGRKPSLIVGIAIFTAASAGCMLAASIHQMLFFRVLQALGAGSPVTISIAIVQDTYQGQAKKKILAILGALFMVAPVLGPSMGSTILLFAPWRMIFALLFVLGVLSLIGCFFIGESAQEKNDKTVLKAFAGLFVVLKNTFFRRALLVFSLPATYALGFVGGSALIFMSEFGQSPARFSIFFAINAGAAIIGSALYIPAAKWFRLKTLTSFSFLTLAVSGIFIVCFGHIGPVVFLLCVLPGSLIAALLRPLSIDLMMNAGGSDSGAASSIINFFCFMFGSIGMQLLSLEWDSRATFYGILAIALGTVCYLMWIFLVSKTIAADQR
jgi:DHA1 family bicyclomycin/chloramphenicol resistance-like MFS transporter